MSENHHVGQAAVAMSAAERATAIAALHRREWELLVAGDLDTARQTAVDKAILLSVHANPPAG